MTGKILLAAAAALSLALTFQGSGVAGINQASQAKLEAGSSPKKTKGKK